MKTIRNLTHDLTSNRLFNFWVALTLGAISTSTGAAHADGTAPQATPQALVQVTSDAVKGIVVISVETDEQGSLTALDYATSTGESKHFDLAELAQGTVLVHTQGMDIVKLSTEAGFDPSKGGKISIDYLHDGLSGSRRTYDTQILPVQSETAGPQWGLFTVADPATAGAAADPAPAQIPELFFKKKKNFLGMTVGIDHVEVHPASTPSS